MTRSAQTLPSSNVQPLLSVELRSVSGGALSSSRASKGAASNRASKGGAADSDKKSGSNKAR